MCVFFFGGGDCIRKRLEVFNLLLKIFRVELFSINRFGVYFDIELREKGYLLFGFVLIIGWG